MIYYRALTEDSFETPVPFEQRTLWSEFVFKVMYPRLAQRNQRNIFPKLQLR